MRTHVFAVGSNTTAEDRTMVASEYFQGLFGMVTGLTDDLSKSADTTLHILSQEFGVVQGDQSITDVFVSEQDSSNEFWDSAQEELLTAARKADVMVILLTMDMFEKTASEVWPELVEQAKPDSIWCIGAAQSSLDSIGVNELKEKTHSVITYRRVGVARLGSEARDELLEKVNQKAD